ncbi:MAG: hypothetical protein RH917_06450 [Lacipirellulaceae bacterium]
MEIAPKFTVDGQPLKEASISFIRSDSEGGRAAFGVTDENGIAKLTTFEPFDGVLPGKYRVVVIKAPENPNTFDVENVDLNDPKDLALLSTGGAMPPKQRLKRRRTLLPEVYADPGTTPLNCEVSGASEDLTFEVDSTSK